MHMRSFPGLFSIRYHTYGAENDENCYRQGREERKGLLKAFLCALRDLGGGYFQDSLQHRAPKAPR